MALASELRNFPEDEKDFEVSRPRASVQPFPSTGMPLSYSSSSLESSPTATEDADLEGSVYDTSLYGQPRLARPNMLDKAYAAVSSGIEASTPYVQASVTKLRNAGKRFNQLKEAQPLQVLGAIAGSAFVLGMVVRFWRSRS
jgi:hypothetical protein